MTPEVGNLVEAAGFMAILVLVSWMVRRVFTHTIPRLAEDFKEALEAQNKAYFKHFESQRDDFKEDLRRQRDDFKEELRKQRGEFKEALKEERENVGRRLDRLTDAVERLITSKL
jgi:hypothetical protein